MSKTYEGGPITVMVVGVTIATSGVTASATIPVDSAGNSPRYIRVSATAAAYVKLSTTATNAAATTNDILVQPADAMILQVPAGVTKINAIQDSGAGKVNVVPLENA